MPRTKPLANARHAHKLKSVRAPFPPEIAAVLVRGGHVLTANLRASRALRRAYAADARERELQSWPVPRIDDWKSWLANLYHAFSLESKAPLPTPLTALQEELLWQRAQREEAQRVVSPQRLAQLASSGYALLCSYNAQASRNAPWAADAHEDAAHFLHWASAFERECARLNVTSAAQIEELLRPHAAQLPLPRELLLAGFDRTTPAQALLLQAFSEAGVTFSHFAAAAPAVERQFVCAQDERNEIEACALWIRTQLAEDPGKRIGVLVPQLAGRRAAIDRTFRRVLLPQSSQAPANGPLPYEFSLGVPLASVPNIAAALSLLAWLAGPLAGAELSSLLRSGFLAADEREAHLLPQSDVRLRRLGWLQAEMPLAALLRNAEREPGLLPEAVRLRLESAHAWVRLHATETRSYGHWAEAARAALTGLGWPGSVTPSSVAYQAQERWDRLLDEMAQLDFVAASVSWRNFVADLRSAAAGTLFAAESQDAPVQVVGIAEASGQNFDAIRVLGMTEENWPLRGRVHPLLAPWVQRDHAMPHATPELDRQLAAEQLRRVASAAPVLVWSYPRQCAGLEQRPSPMLRTVLSETALSDTAATAAELLLPPPRSAVLRTADPLQGAPWPTDRIAGGSEVLKQQAACGFQSFARRRLRASPLEEEAWGLDPGDRATLLHRALEHLWAIEPVPPGSHKMHTSADLQLAIENDSLMANVRAAVTESLRASVRRAAGDPWSNHFLELETRRLTTRLLFWLEQEAERAPFRVVALEKKIDSAHIGELRLRLRLDRADAVAGERMLLLDYKTADQVRVNQWEGERPDEPQLPIYALYGGMEDVAGVAFAQIRAGQGKTGLHALAEAPAEQLGEQFATPEGKPPRHLLTAEMRAGWDFALRALAASFVQGEAPVNPKHGAQTCRLCGMFALCRIRSQRNGGELLAAGEENSDG